MSNLPQKITLEQRINDWLEQEHNGVQFPVDFDEAWKIAGYAQKHHGKRKLTAKTSPLIEGEDYLTQSGEWTVGGRSGDSIFLTCDAFKHFCLMAKTEQGRQIRQYFIEAEKNWKLVQQQEPQFAQEIELQKLRNEGLTLEAQKTQAELNLLQFRNTVITTCSEPVQQKILGYQTVKEVQYRDRVLKDDQVLRDGDTFNKSQLCHRYGILTKNGSPDYKKLNKILGDVDLPQDAWKNTYFIKDVHELSEEYVHQLDQILLDRNYRQLECGE